MSSSYESGLHKENLGGVAYLPRINIDVFCVQDETMRVMEAVAKDRHFSRTNTRVYQGGVNLAIDLYKTSGSPNLLLLEVSGKREEVLETLESLADVCEPGTKVIVLGHVNDVELYRSLMQFGVSDYFVAPFSPSMVIAGVERAYHDSKTNFAGKVYSFFGVKGGVGSSTFAHNIGFLFSQVFDKETLIVDFDLSFGTLGLNFDLDVPQSVFEALVQPERVDGAFLERLISKVDQRLGVLPSTPSFERDFVIQSSAVETVLGVMRSQLSHTVLDVPHVLAPWSRQILLHSDEVILTATPDIASLRNARNIVEYLREACPNDPPPRLILNQVGVPKRSELSVEDFQKALKIDVAVVVSFSPDFFGKASLNAKMLYQIDKNAETVEKLLAFAGGLVGQKQQKITANKTLLSGLYQKWFGR